MTHIPPAARNTATHDTIVFPDRFTVYAWRDPLAEASGFAPAHDYVELLWLPVVGPSGTWLYRRLNRIIGQHDGVTVELANLAAAVGLSRTTGPHTPIQHTLARLVRFGLARNTGSHLDVRASAPPLALRQLQRLPADLQAAHHRLVAAHRTLRTP
jgi:hypothetical protein